MTEDLEDSWKVIRRRSKKSSSKPKNLVELSKVVEQVTNALEVFCRGLNPKVDCLVAVLFKKKWSPSTAFEVSWSPYILLEFPTDQQHGYEDLTKTVNAIVQQYSGLGSKPFKVVSIDTLTNPTSVILTIAEPTVLTPSQASRRHQGSLEKAVRRVHGPIEFTQSEWSLDQMPNGEDDVPF